MKRFYRAAAAAPAEGGWRVELDGRAVKTALGAPQIVSTQALAQAMAAEWGAQGEQIVPASLVLRDMADYAIDIAATDPAGAVEALLRFCATDTLCYRADPDEALFARQAQVWDPLLAAAETRHGLRFVLVSGVIPQPQPPETLARARAVLAALDPFTMAALRTMASLAASMVIALAALEPGAEAGQLWSAANLEEDWQAEQWGWDHDALQLRTKRLAEFTRAQDFARLAGGK